jgi:hypothetical protein
MSLPSLPPALGLGHADNSCLAGGAAPPQAIYDDVQGTYGGAAGQYNAVEPNYGVADAGGHYGEQGMLILFCHTLSI